jgi:hypothetical protein
MCRTLTGNSPFLQGIAAERICRTFDDVNSRAALRDMGADAAGQPGALPPILAMGGYAGAEWVEFDPSWSPAGALTQREVPAPGLSAKGGTCLHSLIDLAAWQRSYHAAAASCPDVHGFGDTTELCQAVSQGLTP